MLEVKATKLQFTVICLSLYERLLKGRVQEKHCVYSVLPQRTVINT